MPRCGSTTEMDVRGDDGAIDRELCKIKLPNVGEFHIYANELRR